MVLLVTDQYLRIYTASSVIAADRSTHAKRHGACQLVYARVVVAAGGAAGVVALAAAEHGLAVHVGAGWVPWWNHVTADGGGAGLRSWSCSCWAVCVRLANCYGIAAAWGASDRFPRCDDVTSGPCPLQVYALPTLELVHEAPLSASTGWYWDVPPGHERRLGRLAATSRLGHLTLLGLSQELLTLGLAAGARARGCGAVDGATIVVRPAARHCC